MSYQNKRIKFSSKLFCKTYINKITKETIYPLLWRKDYIDFMRKKNGYIVYKITCKVTDMSYYGFTSTTLEYRWEGHCSDAIEYNSNNKFHKNIRELGIENWNLEVLETFDTEFFAKAYEIYCIDKFDSIKNGYNSTQGGDGTNGYHCVSHRKSKKGVYSQETLRKIGIAGRNRPPPTQQARENMSKA